MSKTLNGKFIFLATFSSLHLELMTSSFIELYPLLSDTFLLLEADAADSVRRVGSILAATP